MPFRNWYCGFVVKRKGTANQMKWCEIFKTGEHTDSNGNKRVWTFDDLHTIEWNFKNINSDVPICCGHPKTNSPAYGWVEDMKVAGNSLYASFKNVQEEFKTAVQKGLFKTRSISLTKDLVPRHIAFLGGQSPAVKGLEQFCFEAEDTDITISHEFEEGENVETEELKQQLGEKDKKIAELEQEIARQAKEKQTKEFQDFCDSAVAGGHLLPKQKQAVMNILEACSQNETFEFQEGDKTQNAVDVVKLFVLGLGQMDFEEVATKDKVIENSNVDFSDASSIASKIIEIQAEYRQKGIELGSDEAYKKIKKGE